ncbi:MAG: tetratricopeptide (TPR) repeat protein [Myxococcota bacterium]|jgi:tetratricopeptide (TPR) repeat protein
MYNILIAIGLGLLMYGVVAVLLHPIGAVFPAVGVVVLAIFLLTRRTGRQVEAEMRALPQLLQARKVDEAKALLDGVRQRYGRWQILLGGQLEAQVGMLDYIQMKFDDALPRLKKGTFQNWTAWTAIACIHWRRDRRDDAWAAFEKAASAGSKEAIVYAMWAQLLVKAGKRNEAVSVLARGLEVLPESDFLKGLSKRVANKKSIDVKRFPQTYYQFWPEEFAKSYVMRGRRDGGMAGQRVQPRFGGRAAPRR